MEKYTIGIYFNEDLTKVALILKNRPEWQKNLYNAPGGHIEDNENSHKCIQREFQEECGINHNNWLYIGRIINNKNYFCDIFTAHHIANYGNILTKTDESVIWADVNNLPKNIISNLHWLIPFAKNFWQIANNPDYLSFGIFNYNYDQNKAK